MSTPEPAAAAASVGDGKAVLSGMQFGLLEFERPVTCPLNSLIIGSRLDTDIRILCFKQLVKVVFVC